MVNGDRAALAAGGAGALALRRPMAGRGGNAMKVLGIAGYSGSGKTTLVVRLIPELTRRGIRVSTIKHTHHSVSIDRAGDASRALRNTGATEVAVASREAWALLHEHGADAEPSVEALAARMEAVDLVLVEGFKASPHDKIEVHRAAAGTPLLCADDPYIVAVAADTPLDGVRPPVLDLDDIEAIADFVVAHCALDRA